MNTKTMRLPPRRVLTSDKRIISDAVAVKPPESAVTNPPPPPPIKSILKKAPTAAQPPSHAIVVAEPAGSNQLLAGYLANEFLNKGTLFGEQWDPAQAQAGPFRAQSIEPRKTKPIHDVEPRDNKRRRYVEVANILRVDGTHLTGVVNPSQLSRSLKL
ncbi:unnamed protein product [Cochlearia groenlandica]